MSDINEVFGNVIRTLRKRNGLSQETLAYRAEIDRTYMSSIERGKKNPTIKVVYKLSKALGITVSDIMGEFEKNIPLSDSPLNKTYPLDNK